jgi:histone-lysine N-methyltransferase SETMAR
MNLIYRNARRKYLRITASLYSSAICNFVKIIFHQDNAPAHKSVLAMGKLRDLHYELLEHPPYSPDLTPSDLSHFQKLKLFLAVQDFSSNQEAIAAEKGYFADLTKNHYRDGIMALEHRWNKRISLNGDYVEK